MSCTGNPSSYYVVYTNDSNWSYSQQVDVTAHASDVTGNTLNSTYHFTTEGSNLVITTTSLPAGTISSPYPDTELVVTGGTSPYVCTTFSGALPTGLALSQLCHITGTPTGPAGTASFVARVTDTNLATYNRDLSILINAIKNPADFIINIFRE